MCPIIRIASQTFFFLNDAGVFTEMAVAAGVDNGFKNSFQTIMFDFNQDTLPDIYLSNDLCDTNELFINNGDSTFSALPYGTSEFVAIMDGMGVVPTDFNYDGHLDLFIANTNYDNKFFVSDSLLSHTDMAEYLQLDSFRTTWGGEFLTQILIETRICIWPMVILGLSLHSPMINFLRTLVIVL